MINISGHLREERKITGYYNQDVPLIVNCCGKQVFQTQDYFCNRKNGRLDYQIIYIHRGSGHFYLNNEWITLSAGNIVLYRPGIPQYYSYYAKEKPEIYWIHFTGNECENILKQYDIKNCYIGERLYLKLLFQDIITELQRISPAADETYRLSYAERSLGICLCARRWEQFLGGSCTFYRSGYHPGSFFSGSPAFQSSQTAGAHGVPVVPPGTFFFHGRAFPKRGKHALHSAF